MTLTRPLRALPPLALCALVATALGGCTPTERSEPLVHHSVAPTIASRTLPIPATQKGELARLSTGPKLNFMGTGLALPPSKYGYAVEWGCSVSNTKAKAGWELDVIGPPQSMIEASSGVCDGSPHMDVDASLTNGYDAVDFHLTGDYAAGKMYAILVPAAASATPPN